MSILRSNSANFKITVEWLKNRGYETALKPELKPDHPSYPALKTDHPSCLYYFGRSGCALLLKYRLHIESWEEELVFIGAYINGQLCEIKNVNDLIKAENYWMKGTIFKNRDMFNKIKDISK